MHILHIHTATPIINELNVTFVFLSGIQSQSDDVIIYFPRSLSSSPIQNNKSLHTVTKLIKDSSTTGLSNNPHHKLTVEQSILLITLQDSRSNIQK